MTLEEKIKQYIINIPHIGEYYSDNACGQLAKEINLLIKEYEKNTRRKKKGSWAEATCR